MREQKATLGTTGPRFGTRSSLHCHAVSLWQVQRFWVLERSNLELISSGIRKRRSTCGPIQSTQCQLWLLEGMLIFLRSFWASATGCSSLFWGWRQGRQPLICTPKHFIIHRHFYTENVYTNSFLQGETATAVFTYKTFCRQPICNTEAQANRSPTYIFFNTGQLSNTGQFVYVDAPPQDKTLKTAPAHKRALKHTIFYTQKL